MIRPVCCYLSCDREATIEIIFSDPSPEGNYTQSCGLHVLELIGDDEKVAFIAPIEEQKEVVR